MSEYKEYIEIKSAQVVLVKTVDIGLEFKARPSSAYIVNSDDYFIVDEEGFDIPTPKSDFEKDFILKQ